MIRVNARLFAAAAMFVSTDESRYYLHGVYVMPHSEKGAMLIGTDGIRMLVVHDDQGECTKSAIVRLPAALLTECLEWVSSTASDEWGDDEPTKRLGKDRTLKIDDDGKPEVEREVRGLEDCRIDGTFPDWQKALIPLGTGPRSTPAVNGKYLASFGEAAQLLTSADHVRLVGGDTEDKPTVILFSKTFAFGVLMPMRGEVAAPYLIPSFALPKQKVAA
jgi:hypothetical protein